MEKRQEQKVVLSEGQIVNRLSWVKYVVCWYVGVV